MWLLALGVAGLLLLLPTAAEGAAGVRLDAPKAKAKPQSLVQFKGRAGARPSGRVSIQRKAGRRWRTIAKGRTGTKGRFALTWITPSKRAKVAVRAVLGNGSRRVSRTRRFRVLAPKKGAPKIRVSKKTRIISPSVVRKIPPAGQPGKVTYAGGNDAQAGQIMVIGKGEETPEGFLGRVTGVDRAGGKTIVSTVPATLQQAVPEGSMRLEAETVKATPPAQPRAASRVTCEGTVGASIEHDVSFSAGLVLDGSWTLLGGLQSASLEASVRAAIEAAGSCSLAQTTLLRVKGPSISGFVGPVPVVMTSTLTVYLDANAEARAGLSTSASAGFEASAGISWTEAGGFQPTQSFTPHFSFEPPSLSASASVAANLTPTINVELYGLVGPQIALRTGVQLAADSAADPWWALTVPVDLTASIAIRPLGLTSPELHVYQREFTIADAGGPFGAPPPEPDGTNVATPPTSLASGYDFSCGLRSGAAACWGRNTDGQLGNGTNSPSPTPVAVSGIDDAAGIVAGHTHSCILRVHGEVACWGTGGSGRLGNGKTTNSSTPVPVSNMATARGVSAGAEHSCAVTSTRRVFCWGANAVHELGDGGTTPSSVPVEVADILNATAIASGTYHTCARRADGKVSCWGNNGDGRLGNGSGAESAVPVTVSGITDATGVAAGSNHACALRATGEVACWGDGFYGQLGNGSTGDSSVPVAVQGINDATSIEAGIAHTCAVLASGTVKCWGWNNYGQLGNGTTSERSTTPVTVSGITDAGGVTGGLEHSCAFRTNGTMACWGFGEDGELGNGGNSTSPSPVAVTGFP